MYPGIEEYHVDDSNFRIISFYYTVNVKISKFSSLKKLIEIFPLKKITFNHKIPDLVGIALFFTLNMILGTYSSYLFQMFFLKRLSGLR